MATLVLSAAGAALGAASGVSAFGLSGMVLGRAVGATLGRVIDQRLLGSGSEPVEHGRVERFRFTGAGEGAAIARVYGRMRVGGQVIWATQFVETATTTGGGKGAPAQPRTTTYSYSVSLAVALCEGEIARVGRIWADGVEVDRQAVSLRVHNGTQSQFPDPLLEAVEGQDMVPAYRGLAYVVFEDLDLGPFGNRVPQFSFEVVRPARPEPEMGLVPSAADMLGSVALIPGTGEYALSTSPVYYTGALGSAGAANVSAEGGQTDFVQSLDHLTETLPNLTSVSIIYCWFGDDLRAGSCSVKPKVETVGRDGVGQPWSVSGLIRASAEEIARDEDDRPVYGGTPCDAGVIEAIQAIRARGVEVMFYPLMLMEILPGNGLPDPWGGDEQAPLPWRGRVTGAIAPGQPGSTDGTAQNGADCAAFFGNVTAADFSVSNGTVVYSGPPEWSYTRYVLHSAALCAAAGGVDAFCIGTEMRGVTHMRDDVGYPAVTRLAALAAEVRLLLPDADLTYAADWSEYFGHQPQDGSGDVVFHLDPVWSDENIDFIGIDNYMPMSDWRDGRDHEDADWPAIYDLGYLQANIEGGEGWDWYYASDTARDEQRREAITDGFGGTPWIFRYKGMRDWWTNAHTDRVHPSRRSVLAQGDAPSGWVPRLSAAVSSGTGVAELYDAPVVVSGGADVWQTIETPVAVPADADAEFELRLVLLQGSAGGFRARVLLDGAAVVEVIADGDVLAPSVATLAGASAYGLTATTVDGGAVVVRLIFSVPLPGNVTVQVGPGDCAPGEDVTVFGAALSPWPYPVTGWQPQSKPIRFTEFGCAAVDKGTNQPNTFLDPKSSESRVPYFSSGRRDDVIQSQYLRAVLDYWSDPAQNPTSDVYGGPMVDVARAHAWAWDARPWPAFPNDLERWSDGENWQKGHWLTGRLDAAPLDLVVADICTTAGLDAFDVSELYGVVRGHLSGETETARAALQPLMLAYGFDAVETEGRIQFRHSPTWPETEITSQQTALGEDDRGGIRHLRAARAETIGRLRIGFVDGEATYDDRLAEAVLPGDDANLVTDVSVPMALIPAEAQAVVERRLAEARVARDTVSFSLPPSARALGAGAMFALDDASTWRVDTVLDRGTRDIEAVRVEPSTTEPSDVSTEPPALSPFLPPLPVTPIFMDLPLLTGDEVPHAPHLAVAASPWPGSVAVYKAPGADGFTLNRIVERGAVAGTLLTPLAVGPVGLWDRGAVVRVRLGSGQLSSAETAAVLNGANVAAIGPGDGAGWEVIQFANATLVAEEEWELSVLLRGQAGSDADMPTSWPVGSLFVLMDGAVGQVELPASARGLSRVWRVGPGKRPLDDPSYVDRDLAFDGIGLRPLRPVHLRAVDQLGDLDISWIRRGRVDADSWAGQDVPLGETEERYHLRITDASGLLRETELSSPSYTYSAVDRAADGAQTPFAIEIAQVSDRFGPGPYARIEIND